MSRKGESGFTLIELLVVMVIVGVLAGIAVPAYLIQKRKASETSAKADVRQIVHELQTFYVDGTGALSLTGGPTPRTWRLLDSTATVVATGPLSNGGAVSATSAIASDTSYCVAVVPAQQGARAWRADQSGLHVGDC